MCAVLCCSEDFGVGQVLCCLGDLVLFLFSACISVSKGANFIPCPHFQTSLAKLPSHTCDFFGVGWEAGGESVPVGGVVRMAPIH